MHKCVGFIGFGYSLLFHPDSDGKELSTRVYGTTLTSLGIYALLPKFFQTTSETYDFHSRNLIIAISSGSLLALGYSLFHHTTAKLKTVITQCLGGASLIVGFYLWFPYVFRLLWEEVDLNNLNNLKMNQHHHHHNNNAINKSINTTLISPKIKIRGGLIAFINGYLYGSGYDYFYNYYYNDFIHHNDHNIQQKYTKKPSSQLLSVVTVDNDHEVSLSSSLSSTIMRYKRPLGAGLFALGTYIFMPPYVRLFYECIFT